MAELFAYLDGFGTGGSLTKSVIIAKAPTGSTVTCTKGDVVKRATEKNGEWRFNGLDIGTWTLRAEISGQAPVTKDVKITEFGVYRETLEFVKIYGIVRNTLQQSPEWTRTDNAVGFTATASVGTVAGHSDFDGCYPWSEIKREVLPAGDTMVKIPKFWYQRTLSGNIETIRISDHETEGFKLHPAFNHGGVVKDAVYIGAFETSSGNKSVSGASPTVNMSIDDFRASAQSKGAGWHLFDGSGLSALQMLILVEFPSYAMQTVVGQGNVNNTAIIKTGGCDTVPGLTGVPSGTTGKIGVVWRGIENPWGNTRCWIDGFLLSSYKYYVCNDPDKYGVQSSYTELSYRLGTSDVTELYIKKLGYDEGGSDYVMLPEISTGASSTTFVTDAVWLFGTAQVLSHGGAYNQGVASGLFCTMISTKATTAREDVGARLMYIPEVE